MNLQVIISSVIKSPFVFIRQAISLYDNITNRTISHSVKYEIKATYFPLYLNNKRIHSFTYLKLP